MIEVRSRDFQVLPSGGIVTRGAFIAERSLMMIGMAGAALREFYSAEFQVAFVAVYLLRVGLRRMALAAIDGRMFPLEFESRTRMRKGVLLPRCGGVASVAFRLELPAMLVVVTVVARRIESQMRLFLYRAAFLFDIRRDDIRRPMALPALQRRMLSFQIESRLFMIERRGIPTD
jgi:hypothetical protein